MSQHTPTLQDLDETAVFEGMRWFQEYCYAASRNKGFQEDDDRLQQASDLVHAMDLGPDRDLLLSVLTKAFLDRLGNGLLLAVGEIVEGQEEIRSGRAPNETYYVGRTSGTEYGTQSPIALEKPEGLPSEVADAVIRLFTFAAKYKIDLPAIIREKLAYNETRPYRHGRKEFG